jgi:DNA-binding response OmpR family regulator
MPSIYTYFCPICMIRQNTFDQLVEGRLQIRCLACGYPVDEGVPSAGEITFHKQKILFIDDEKMQLQLFTDVMKKHEFIPLTAVDGPSGIALAVRERPALILIDVMMPNMDGYEVCRRLRAVPGLRGTALVIFTVLTDPKLNSKGFQAGADLAFTKTFVPEKLIPIIRTLLWLKGKQGKEKTAG